MLHVNSSMPELIRYATVMMLRHWKHCTKLPSGYAYKKLKWIGGLELGTTVKLSHVYANIPRLKNIPDLKYPRILDKGESIYICGNNFSQCTDQHRPTGPKVNSAFYKSNCKNFEEGRSLQGL